uniref:Uncharacterized protein n=1 Tax=Heterosigma akashiwo TaxID=2829 RepID=A0A7S3UZ85_HETAK
MDEEKEDDEEEEIVNQPLHPVCPTTDDDCGHSVQAKKRKYCSLPQQSSFDIEPAIVMKACCHDQASNLKSGGGGDDGDDKLTTTAGITATKSTQQRSGEQQQMLEETLMETSRTKKKRVVVIINFNLGAGSFATMALREIMKLEEDNVFTAYNNSAPQISSDGVVLH